MKKEKLIPRLYRVTKKQDDHIKSMARVSYGESYYIRFLIDLDIARQKKKANKSFA